MAQSDASVDDDVLCVGCGEPVGLDEELLMIDSRPFHEHCLCCVECSSPLALALQLFPSGTRFKCVDCGAPNCVACQEKILSGGITATLQAEPRSWHSRCFLCAYCKRPINGRYLPSLQDPSQPSCVPCRTHADSSSRRSRSSVAMEGEREKEKEREDRAREERDKEPCAVCKNPIASSAKTAEFEGKQARFHPDCFLCNQCGEKIQQNFFCLPDRPSSLFCAPCFEVAKSGETTAKNGNSVARPAEECSQAVWQRMLLDAGVRAEAVPAYSQELVAAKMSFPSALLVIDAEKLKDMNFKMGHLSLFLTHAAHLISLYSLSSSASSSSSFSSSCSSTAPVAAGLSSSPFPSAMAASSSSSPSSSFSRATPMPTTNSSTSVASSLSPSSSQLLSPRSASQQSGAIASGSPSSSPAPRHPSPQSPSLLPVHGHTPTAPVSAFSSARPLSSPSSASRSSVFLGSRVSASSAPLSSSPSPLSPPSPRAAAGASPALGQSSSPSLAVAHSLAPFSSASLSSLPLLPAPSSSTDAADSSSNLFLSSSFSSSTSSLPSVGAEGGSEPGEQRGERGDKGRFSSSSPSTRSSDKRNMLGSSSTRSRWSSLATPVESRSSQSESTEDINSLLSPPPSPAPVRAAAGSSLSRDSFSPGSSLERASSRGSTLGRASGSAFEVLSTTCVVTDAHLGPNPYSQGDQKWFQFNIVRELILTEQEYILDLGLLIDLFLLPLSEKKIISEMESAVLFSNVTQLRPVNLAILNELVVRNDDILQLDIGQILLGLSEYLKMYKIYCANQQSSLSLLESLTKTNKKFSSFLEEASKDARCRGLFMISFLIKPVQRVCKYPLLIRELIKYTAESDPHYEGLIAARDKIGEVVDAINSSERRGQTQKVTAELLVSVEGLSGDDLMSPSRFFIQEGDFLVKSAVHSSPEPMHLWLFNDLVLVCNKKKGLKKELRWKLQFVSEFKDLRPQGDVDNKLAFNIENIKNSTLSLSFICSSEAEQKDWFEKIKKCRHDCQISVMKRAQSIGK